MSTTLSLEGWTRRRHELALAFRLHGHRIERTYRYGDVDFTHLEERFGAVLLDRLCAYLLALEAVPLVGLAPDAVDFGPASRFLTFHLRRLWRAVERGTGAQWRYETGRPFYRPAISAVGPAEEPLPMALGASSTEALVFCGGGKDSLAVLTLLERSGIDCATFSYSQPEYGSPEEQHRLIDRTLDAAPGRRHRLEVLDGAGRRELDGLICAETPISVFAALPVALQHGYRCLVLGHERSADTANLLWEETGEAVNHQWGKSLEAERLLADAVRHDLLADVRCFSVLKPVHDPVIAGLLRGNPDAVRRTHSCNVRKPWCERCPKCLYVWLLLTAFLPADAVAPMFTGNLLEVPENLPLVRRLLGLDGHRPFECVGEPAEARLAFELCRRKGVLGGAATDRLAAELPDFHPGSVFERYLVVHEDSHAMPPAVWELVAPQLRAAAEETRRYVGTILRKGT